MFVEANCSVESYRSVYLLHGVEAQSKAYGRRRKRPNVVDPFVCDPTEELRARGGLLPGFLQSVFVWLCISHYFVFLIVIVIQKKDQFIKIKKNGRNKSKYAVNRDLKWRMRFIDI